MRQNIYCFTKTASKYFRSYRVCAYMIDQRIVIDILFGALLSVMSAITTKFTKKKSRIQCDSTTSKKNPLAVCLKQAKTLSIRYIVRCRRNQYGSCASINSLQYFNYIVRLTIFFLGKIYFSHCTKNALNEWIGAFC